MKHKELMWELDREYEDLFKIMRFGEVPNFILKNIENHRKNTKKILKISLEKQTFHLDFIVEKTAKSECLLCKINLDKKLGKGKWHIPLCDKHRLEYMEKKK